jgi:heme/copper-type cytochrome/quinol oxidase subunit 1
VPLFAWSSLVAGTVWLLTLPVLAGLAVLSYLDARYGGFIGGGEGSIFSRISWAFGTPTVYVLAVPVVGFVGSVIPVAAQTRHHLHRVALGLIGALGVLSVGAWTMPNLAGSTPWLYDGPWVAVSIAASVPLLGLLGLWAATVRAGKVVLSSPLLFAVVAILLALLGVAAGAVQAIKPIETLVDDGSTTLYGTSWSTGVTALLLLAGAAAAIGGVVYWAPKIFGARLHEGGARLVALLVFLGSAVGCIATLAAGLLGEPGPAILGPTDNLDAIKSLDLVVTIGDGVLGLAGLLFILLVLRAAFRGEDPGDDPWSGHTLEWATASPPPPGNFTTVPAVTSEAPVYDARHAQGADA